MAPAFIQLSNITLSNTTNSIPAPFFGLGDALKIRFNSPSTSAPYPSLFAHGCAQPGNTHNCTTSCSKLDQQFGSLDTLHNCVVWPQLYHESINEQLSPAAFTLAKSLGVERQGGGDQADLALPSLISNNIQNCLLDSCDQDDECGPHARAAHSGNYRKHFTAKVIGQAYYGSGNLPRYFNPCDYITSPANADVAGIGVFISYVMQLGLALIAFVFAIPWKRGARSVRNNTLKLFSKRRPSAISSKERLSNSNPNPKPNKDKTNDPPDQQHALTFAPSKAVVPFVVEFQKSQCYFMLATNIASLIIQHRGGLAPDSFQQLENTYIFIKVIAIGGYLPITFTLLTLRMLRKMSWLVLTLSIATVGVSIADLYTEQYFSPRKEDLDHLRDASKQGGPPSCGGNNPVAWCYNRIGIHGYAFRQTNAGDGADAILKFCLIVLVILTLEHFFFPTDATGRKIRNTFLKPFSSLTKNRRRKDLPAGGEKKLTALSRVLAVVKWFLIPLLIIVIVLLYLYALAFYAYDLNWFRRNKIYDPEWGFGQVVAILVWAPPIFEFLWKTFRGIKEGSDHALPPGYEVTKKKVGGASEDEESD